MSDGQQLTAWLLAEAGPVVRYLTASELLEGVSPRELAQLHARCMESPLVQRWLANLSACRQFHGSLPTSFENAAGKLARLGCRAGFAVFDGATARTRRWLAEARGASFDELYNRVLVAAFLEVCGYGSEPAVAAVIRERLEELVDFTRRMRFDIYVPTAGVAGYPRHFVGVPLVDPRLCPRVLPPLPSLVDVHALVALRARRSERRSDDACDTVVRWIVADGYRELAPGYGVMQIGPRRFWKIGYDVAFDAPASRGFLQNLEILAHFPAALASGALARRIADLERFRTADGSYLFPAAMLRERRSGYWVHGSYMALEDGRRSRSALELESTFRALRIQKLAARAAMERA